MKITVYRIIKRVLDHIKSLIVSWTDIDQDIAYDKKMRQAIRRGLQQKEFPPIDICDQVLSAVKIKPDTSGYAIMKEGWWNRPLFTPKQLSLAFSFVLGMFALTFFSHFSFSDDTLSLTQKMSPGLEVVRSDKETIHVKFELEYPRANQVELIGDFNNWGRGKAMLSQDEQGRWSIQLPLAKGKYQYQFLVNGQKWISDPKCQRKVDDGFGNQNSVISI